MTRGSFYGEPTPGLAGPVERSVDVHIQPRLAEDRAECPRGRSFIKNGPVWGPGGGGYMFAPKVEAC